MSLREVVSQPASRISRSSGKTDRPSRRPEREAIAMEFGDPLVDGFALPLFGREAQSGLNRPGQSQRSDEFGEHPRRRRRRRVSR
jgi:hypothetical protein